MGWLSKDWMGDRTTKIYNKNNALTNFMKINDSLMLVTLDRVIINYRKSLFKENKVNYINHNTPIPKNKSIFNKYKTKIHLAKTNQVIITKTKNGRNSIIISKMYPTY